MSRLSFLLDRSESVCCSRMLCNIHEYFQSPLKCLLNMAFQLRQNSMFHFTLYFAQSILHLYNVKWNIEFWRKWNAIVKIVTVTRYKGVNSSSRQRRQLLSSIDLAYNFRILILKLGVLAGHSLSLQLLTTSEFRLPFSAWVTRWHVTLLYALYPEIIERLKKIRIQPMIRLC